MKIQLSHKFEDIISIDNLLLAWQEFIKGKRNRYWDIVIGTSGFPIIFPNNFPIITRYFLKPLLLE